MRHLATFAVVAWREVMTSREIWIISGEEAERYCYKPHSVQLVALWGVGENFGRCSLVEGSRSLGVCL
jgi:hypothetical protein